jgi:hypothetical protein
MAAFYPEPKPVPATLRTRDLHLEMLSPEHVELDYDALMSSWPRLQIWSGSDRWPRPDFTLEENLSDLTEHRDEFVSREASPTLSSARISRAVKAASTSTLGR